MLKEPSDWLAFKFGGFIQVHGPEVQAAFPDSRL